jgi:hypothetical protein
MRRLKFKLNIREFASRFAFAITLITIARLSVSGEGLQRVSDYGLAVIIGFAALAILFENISSKRVWKSIVYEVKDMDIVYVEFGLGLMLCVSAFSDSAPLVILLLMSGGAFVGSGIAKLEVGGYLKLLKYGNVAVAFSFVWLFAGVIYGIMIRNLITAL